MHPYFLTFHRPFVLAHGTRSGTDLAFVKIEWQGIIAYGEASLPPYLPESFDSVNRWVHMQHDEVMKALDSDPFSDRSLIPFSALDPAASAAIQSAILNWQMAAKGKRLIDQFPSSTVPTGLTLTLTKNDYEVLDEKLELALQFTHLKLKLTGEDDDLAFVKAIRNRTDLAFCIDVNQGFNSPEDALKTITALESLNCILVEQPLKDSDHDGHYWLKQRTQLPIIADESIRQYRDLEQYHEAYSGVNIKLMKCGGLFQAERMLNFEVKNDGDKGFIKLLGCMSESTLGVAMSAVLASHAEIADLDAPYLCRNDPFEGFRIKNGKIELDENIRLRSGHSFY